MKKYVPGEIEEKWQNKWSEDNLYASDLQKPNKHYVLAEYAYPSGDLHMGHWFTFSGADIYARFKRMQGYQVFFPNGFDAFGLPAENAAIKRGIHPQEWTLSNIEAMKKQFNSMGVSLSFDHEVISCLPSFYKWNQWIFLRLYEKRLAYKGKYISNWCGSCQTVLAAEGVEAGRCWRCDTQVVQKEVSQWFIKITDYADRLIWPKNPKVDWPQSVREGQNSWIGKSEGTIIRFQMSDIRDQIEVFTVYPETIFGVTYMVLAPEHKLVEVITTLNNRKQVKKYIEQSKKKSELERKVAEREKTGVFTGAYCINPLNNTKVPIWVADYVIASYGTGAIMGVPGSDHRDFAYARKYNLPIIKVIASKIGDFTEIRSEKDVLEKGFLVNSGQYDDLDSKVARSKITEYIEKQNIGSRQVQYHLRDWSVSRQRYWGTPVPIIYCSKCWELKIKNSQVKIVEGKDYILKDGKQYAIIPVSDDDLPVELPYDVDYTPKGRPPLATNKEWLRVKCPKCRGYAQRDPETLDTFVDSAWYFFRYLSPMFDTGPFDTRLAKKMMPVDIYFGGAEHTLGHTLYSRFLTKFFHDLGLINFEEYALKRVNHGVILGPDGYRMSKSRGNVVNPDSEVQKYGADALRIHLAFFIPYAGTNAWVSEHLWGPYRFLERLWNMFDKISNNCVSAEDLRVMHKTIKKVTEDIANIKFNTAIASLMKWLNYLSRKKDITQDEYRTFLLILAPFAPHMSEELWDMLNSSTDSYSIHKQPWPKYDPALIKDEQITIAVQIDGKTRDQIMIQNKMAYVSSSDYKDLEKEAVKRQKVQKFLGGKKIKKVIFVPDRPEGGPMKILNLVTKD